MLAGRERLRPIVMTTFAAIGGLLPLAFGIGAGAAMERPLAIAVIGGLSTATLFTLVLIPALYASLYGQKRRSVIVAIVLAAIPVFAELSLSDAQRRATANSAEAADRRRGGARAGSRAFPRTHRRRPASVRRLLACTASGPVGRGHRRATSVFGRSRHLDQRSASRARARSGLPPPSCWPRNGARTWRGSRRAKARCAFTLRPCRQSPSSGFEPRRSRGARRDVRAADSAIAQRRIATARRRPCRRNARASTRRSRARAQPIVPTRSTHSLRRPRSIPRNSRI